MTATLSRRRDTDGDEPRRGWSRRTILGVVVAIVMLALAAVWVVAFSPLFGVRTVTVRGEHEVSAQKILTVAAVPHGDPLVRLDTQAVARRVETIDGVFSADVTTSYPSTVVITVVERMAVGVVKSDGSYTLVDRTGDQFKTVSALPKDLPLFVLPTGDSARSTGASVATVASAIPASVRARIESIQALDPDAVTLQLRDGRVVRWGSPTRNGEKAQILPALLKRPGQQFDVTDPTRPFSR